MANTKKTTKPKAETTESVAKPAKKVKKVTLDEIVDVQSCVMGKLVWKSKKTGYKIIWNEFGAINPMAVSDLLDMRNGTNAFFEKNWVVILGDRADAVMEYLRTDRYYKDVTTPDELDEILTGNPNDIEAVLNNFNPTMKQTAAARAAQLFADGVLDSTKIITAVKNATGYDISI